MNQIKSPLFKLLMIVSKIAKKRKAEWLKFPKLKQWCCKITKNPSVLSPDLELSHPMQQIQIKGSFVHVIRIGFPLLWIFCHNNRSNKKQIALIFYKGKNSWNAHFLGSMMDMLEVDVRNS